MTAKVSNDFLDASLNLIKTDGTVVHVLIAEVTDYADIAANSLGSAIPTYGDITDNIVDDIITGRKVIMNNIVEADVLVSDKATHFAITDGATTVHICQALFAEQDLIAGNKFNLSACTIRAVKPVA